MQDEKQIEVPKPASAEELLKIVEGMQQSIGGGLVDIREEEHRDDKERGRLALWFDPGMRT
jgi:hypothetical protein